MTAKRNRNLTGMINKNDFLNNVEKSIQCVRIKYKCNRENQEKTEAHRT